ncbi:MAG: metabolite traffic protein EboE [Deltaproteobacteria bacterium]|nr:metabolite traffic protein EboE [Deltaproteobacteria bacterium]
MHIGANGFFHLTYCTKVHPGCGWEELFGNLQALVPRLKARFAPERPFGLGLRLSDAESRELLAADHLARFQDFLAHHDLYVFTLNGFPYGTLTGQPVKEGIFAPDWRATKRLDYTLRLVDILARLLPEGVDGGISSLPLSYKPWIAAGDAEALAQITANLVRLTARLIEVEADTGKLIHLDLEPEPDGLLECSREVVEFFQTWLLGRGASQLARTAGVSEAEARHCLLRYLRVCLDTCHLAVAYEDPAAALAALAQNGIQVGKVQITAGLKVTVPANGGRASLARQLEPFTHSPYLHQVSAREDGGRSRRFPDLWQALALIDRCPPGQWRIHYHMPLFVERCGDLSTTATETREVLRLLREQQFCPHLEIETYTWEWLPPDLKLKLLDSLTEEYRWVLEAMGEGRGQPSAISFQQKQRAGMEGRL